MACNMPSFFIVNDTELESERNGDAAIYWAAPSTWTALRGCSSFELHATALQIDTAAECDVFLEYGSDGVSWQPYNSGTGLLSDDPIDPDNRSESRRINLPDEVLYAPFIRLGVQVDNDTAGTSQVRARLIVAVVPIKANDRVITSQFANDIDVDTVTVDTLFGNAIEAEFAKSACILLSSDITANAFDVAVHGSIDGTTYVPITNATLTVNSTNMGGTIHLGEGSVPPWIQLYLDAKTVSTGTNVTGHAVLRNY